VLSNEKREGDVLLTHVNRGEAEDEGVEAGEGSGGESPVNI